MDEKQVKKLIQQGIQEASASTRFQLTPVSRHVHNGLDSPNVSAVNLIYNNKVLTGLTATGETTLITIDTGVANPTTIYSFGFARSPVSGTATSKTNFQGQAQLGNCFTQTSINAPSTKSSIIQICSGTQFVDPGSGIYTPSVFVNDLYIATGVNLDPTKASIQVVSFSGTKITFNIIVDVAWEIICNLIIV